MEQHAMSPQHNSVSVAILPTELIVEIFSFLPVKRLIRFRCINKFFKTLVTDPHFVQMHLNNSSRNSQLLASTYYENYWNSSLVPLSIPGLLQNQFIMFHDDPYYRLDPYSRIVGSCNGLLLVGSSFHSYLKRDSWLWFYFWNPATRTKSNMFTIFCSRFHHLNVSFGYDNLNRTYKVVTFYMEANIGGSNPNPKSVVKVFSSRERLWRDIHRLPVYPLNCDKRYKNNGVHLNGTINWIGLRDYMVNSSPTVDQYVILSLDLSTETYTQLLPPPRFDKVPRFSPKLVVLKDCLCFCHNFERTHFIIWQMKEFGVQDSWIQLFTISYYYEHQHFFKWWDLFPLYLYENGDTMIFANEKDNEAIIYNRRYNTGARMFGNSNKILWSQANDYVESLVSTQ